MQTFSPGCTAFCFLFFYAGKGILICCCEYYFMKFIGRLTNSNEGVKQ